MTKTEALTREKVCSIFQDVSRKVPLAIKKDLEKELERLLEIGILTKVTQPTSWVSSLIVARKPNGKLRVCIDPQDLNIGLQRAHYPMPNIEDILPDLPEVKCFSVLNAKEEFWHAAWTTRDPL